MKKLLFTAAAIVIAVTVLGSVAPKGRISNISDIQREKGAPGHTGYETSDYHGVKVITYNLIYKHKFTFVN